MSLPVAGVDRYGDPLPAGAVARLGTVRLGHSGVIHAVAFAPDGKTLASHATDGTRYWDTRTGQRILNPSAENRTRIGDLLDSAMGRKAVSPDGKIEATGGDDGVITFSGGQPRTLKYPSNFEYGRFRFLGYASGGKHLVSFVDFGRSPNVGECLLWDLATGKVLQRWESACAPVAISPNGKLLAIGAKGYGIQLRDLATNRLLRQFDVAKPSGVSESEVARCATFSPDGKLLAVADNTNRVYVWEAETGKELYRSPPFRNWVSYLAFSPDGTTLAVGNWHRILLWEATTGKDLLTLGGHANQVGRVTFAPDGKTVATQSEDAMILWDPQTGRERQRWSDKKIIAFSPGGDMLLRVKGSIVQWQPAMDKTLRTFKVYEREIAEDIAEISVVFSRDGKAMVSGSSDRTIRLWNFETGKELWKAKRKNKDRRFPADIGGHWPLGFTHDGKAVVSMADDAVLRFWDVTTGKEVRWFRIDSREAALSPDGRFLVAIGQHVAAADGYSETTSAAPPRLWDLAKEGSQPTELYSQSAEAPTFSPDGKVVALAIGADIVLVDRASRKELRRLKGHQDGVLDLAFSLDGRLLVSGSHDLTALVWDLR